jgi:hypothetical protein
MGIALVWIEARKKEMRMRAMRKVFLVVLFMFSAAVRGQILISEFMAGGNTVLADEDGQYPDWIEIHNAGDAAVNLGGWGLTDQTNNWAKWSFPATSLPAHGFLVVFASGKDRRVAGKPLHTNFKLNSAGEYLALTQSDGVTKATEFAPYPKQYSGISYGIGHSSTLIADGAAARIQIPTSGALGAQWTAAAFDDSGWTNGQNGVGFEISAPGFACKVYVANTTVNSLAVAEQVIADTALQQSVSTANMDVVNFLNNGGGQHFYNDLAFPGLEIGSDMDNFVLEATATVTIPSAGYWSFGVNSDDGFGLTIGDQSMAWPDPRGSADTVQSFYFPAAGDYPLRLVFYEQGGDSQVEMYAASGSYSSWVDGVFTLVGDTAGGGLKVLSTPVDSGGGSSYRSYAHTDVASAMLNQQVSAYVRIPFVATNLAGMETLTLGARYDDGFAAYLNGTLVAQRNAPATPAWNTPATATHQAIPAETIDLSAFRSYLREGSNVLAIQGMNRTAGDPRFLIQVELTEFGLGDGTYSFLSPATPGEINGTSFPSMADPVQFSLPGGVFGSNLVVSLSAPNPSATIRFTQDNSTPGETSAVYTGPITVSASTSIRARAYVAGQLPSEPAVEVYTLLGSDLLAFRSQLPLIILNTYGKSIQQDMTERVPATITVINTSTNTGTASLLDAPEFHGQAGVEGRGQTSWGFAKKPYNLAFRNQDGDDQAVSVLGMPAGADFVLLNLYNDKTFMNDFLAHELFEKMGHYAVRRHYVEVFLNGSHPDGNDTSGKVTYSDYVGIYLLLEKIKIDKHRVDIAKLDAGDTAEPRISGGYIFKKDKDSPDDVTFYTTTTYEALKFHDPKGNDLTAGQRQWFMNYLNKFESALYGSAWKNPTTGYPGYIDIDTFVDYHWIVEFSKQIDGYRLSNYLHKDRNGKIKIGPIWDWNLSFGNADYNDGDSSSGWYYKVISEYDHLWLRRLISNPGDPDFNQKIADRWSVLRTNIFAPAKVLGRMDELTVYLQQAQARDFARWPRLNGYVWPNPPGLAYVNSHQEAVNYVKNWISNRFNWIDSQYLIPPVFSRAEGPVQVGDPVSLSAAKGVIYYTLDGADPRKSGGGIAPGAIKYTDAIALTNNARVFARAYYTNAWSGPATATYYTHTPALAITEIMYHPVASGTNSADDFQYLELMNTGTVALNLTGFHFTQGIEFAFTEGSLAPGQRVLLVANLEAFQSRYGAGLNVGGVFTNTLAHSGERLTLVGPMEEPVLDFTYDDKWYPLTDGKGYSLTVVNEQTAFSDWGNTANWASSAKPGGSPGTAESTLQIQSVTYVGGLAPAVKIGFNAAANRAYRLQYSESLANPVWQTLSEVAAQSAAHAVEISDGIPAGQGARYYRLQAL